MFPAKLPLMTMLVLSMESSCLTLILRFVISQYNLFNLRARYCFQLSLEFSLPSKRDEEVDDLSVMDGGEGK